MSGNYGSVLFMKVIDRIKKELADVQSATGTTGNEHVRAILLTGATIGFTSAMICNPGKQEVIKAVQWLESELRGIDVGYNDGRAH